MLLTLAVALGLALSVRWQRPRWPRLITNDLHRFVTLLSLVFIGVHGLAAWLDPFMRFGWAEVLVPLASHYRPLWMALGIVAGYLALAVWLSTALRPRISYTWWRRLHGLAFAVYALATIHGLATGSDTQSVWALGIYAGSVLLVGGLLGYRQLTPIGARGRTYPNLAGLLALVVVGGVLWTATGPARAGWNAIANNGQGSGARVGVLATASGRTSGTFAPPFTAGVQGTLQPGQADGSGQVTLRLTGTLRAGAQGTLQVLLQGQVHADGSVAVSSGQVMVAGPGGAPQYQGALTALQDEDAGGVRLQAQVQASDGRALTVTAALQLTEASQVSGTVRVAPAGA